MLLTRIAPRLTPRAALTQQLMFIEPNRSEVHSIARMDFLFDYALAAVAVSFSAFFAAFAFASTSAAAAALSARML